MSTREDVQNAAENGQLIVGTKEVLKNISTVSDIVIAANIPDGLYDRVTAAADESDIPIEEIEVNNRELGSLCMKPFGASVVGITK